MVGGEAAADAVARAHRLPELRVGLHLNLTDGNPVLPRDEISCLVRENGEFDRNMARAGVRPDIAERVLGHVIAGVEGIYDRHAYRDEKAHALRALAGLIDTILHGT